MNLERLRTSMWFAGRPNFWRHAIHLAGRKLLPTHESAEMRERATEWAAIRAVSVSDALRTIGLQGETTGFPAHLMTEAQLRAERSAVNMGGPGDLNLLFDAVRCSGATRVVETGVAYGWSSFAILAAFQQNGGGRLVSVDMPYPKMGNEAYVGIVVPERLRASWTLIREPDNPGLAKALQLFDGSVDLCHYDSDKTWWGRKYAFPRLWNALRIGGVFISDDIQDNLFFSQFSDTVRMPFAVTQAGGKYAGMIRKTS